MQVTTVGEAKEIAREWILETASDIPGFLGASFRGSINWMHPDAPFPSTSDIDIGLISDGSTDLPRFGMFAHRGLLIEAGIGSISQFDDIESLLGDYRRSASFWKKGVVVDPTGELTRIQNQVASEYTKPKWIHSRIEDAVANSNAYVDRLDESDPFAAQVINWAFAEGVMCHVLLAGGLQNPTVRRRYSETRQLMENAGHLGVYEHLLVMFGCGDMTTERVVYHLEKMVSAFDAAKLVEGSKFPLARDITEVARPLAVDGSRALVVQGEHREAVYWIVVTMARSLAMLRGDGRTGDAERVENDLRMMLDELGVSSFEKFAERANSVRDFLPELKTVARELSEVAT